VEVVDDDAVVEARQPHFTGQMFAIADAPHISVVTAANGHALSCRPSAHTAVTVDAAVVVGVGVGVDAVEVVVVVVGRVDSTIALQPQSTGQKSRPA